ncbi:MAG TPA: hypothetical protein VGJ20_38330, partial [Xanthobacteraceae bacterium]
AGSPSTRLSESGSQLKSIYLPRQSLISHLGFEPQLRCDRAVRAHTGESAPSARDVQPPAI